MAVKANLKGNPIFPKPTSNSAMVFSIVSFIEILEVFMTNEQRTPEGDLLLLTLAMTADTNANGDIFGGWIMSRWILVELS